MLRARSASPRRTAATGGSSLRAAGPAAAAAAITGLTWLSVRQDPGLARLGPLPLTVALWAAFAAGAWLILRTPPRRAIPLILLGGLAVQLAALSAPPGGSDDLYRYIWDGRVQAAGISPYRYVPAASQLANLRDGFLWPVGGPHCITAGRPPGPVLRAGCTRINRPTVPTVYPPVAQAYFLIVGELSFGGGSVPVQAAAALIAVATTVLLLLGLHSLGRDPRLAVLWAWCPVVALEAGNNAHVDVLAALLAAASLLILARPGGLRRGFAGGALLGLSIAAKTTPILVSPAVLRRRPVTVLTAAVAAAGAVYLPHLLAVGGGALGYLPGYLAEQGYSTGQRFRLLTLVVPERWATIAAVAVLLAVAAAVLRYGDPDRPWRGAVVTTGAALAVTTPWITWYSILLVVLVALDGRAEWLALAAARYFTPVRPLPHVILSQPGRIGYGAALAVIVAVWLIRRVRKAAATKARQSVLSSGGVPGRLRSERV